MGNHPHQLTPLPQIPLSVTEVSQGSYEVSYDQGHGVVLIKENVIDYP